MVRACAWIIVSWALLFPATRTLAGGQNPFGSGEVKPVVDNPFGDNRSSLDDDTKPSDSDPFAREPTPRPTSATGRETRRADPAPSTNERVRAALDEPTRIEFVDSPLQDAMNYLKDLHQIEIQLDIRALEDAGIGSDTPMRRTLTGIPLRSALHIMLADFDMAYVVKDDILLITTQEKASQMREVRVYDVTELVAPDAQANEVGQMLSVLMSEGVQQSVGGQLVPPGLQNVRIVPMRDLLVVRASQDEHDEIERVLSRLAIALRNRK